MIDRASGVHWRPEWEVSVRGRGRCGRSAAASGRYVPADGPRLLDGQRARGHLRDGAPVLPQRAPAAAQQPRDLGAR